MPFRIIRDDITRVRADAIVNTANPRPVIGSGTDQAIYEAAGAEALLAERKKIGSIPPGEVAVTGAHALQARYILHTVGPSWDGRIPETGTGQADNREAGTGSGTGSAGTEGVGSASGKNKALLASCYRKSLLLAQQLGCESIAFPLISSGNYRYPKEEALRIALDSIRTFLEDSEMDVTLVVYDKNSYALSSELTDHVDAYIDEKYVEEHRKTQSRPDHQNVFYGAARPRREQETCGAYREDSVFSAAFDEEESSSADYWEPSAPMAAQAAPRPSMMPETAEQTADSAPAPQPKTKKKSRRPSPFLGRKLKDLIGRKSETFQEQLLRLIDEKGYTDVEVYKRANLDRKLFSKIRCNPAYQPQKRTALALAMALKLNMDETTDLLRRAGLALSPASRADLIVEYCIVNRIYDLFEVNALLFDYDQPLLG